MPDPISLRRLARDSVQELLRSSGFFSKLHPEDCRKFPIDELCNHLGIKVKLNPSIVSRGELRSPMPQMGEDFWMIELRPRLSYTEKRFIMAHELGHWHIHKAGTIRSMDEEAFCNEFARELLLGPPILADWVRRSSERGLSLASLLEGAHAAGVGHFPFVRALMYEKTHQQVDPAGLIFASLLKSSKCRAASGELRIVSAAPPERTYLPANRRLCSVGLETLSQNFYLMHHGEVRTYVGSITLRLMQNNWRESNCPCTLDYMKLGQHGTHQYLIAVGRLI